MRLITTQKRWLIGMTAVAVMSLSAAACTSASGNEQDPTPNTNSQTALLNVPSGVGGNAQTVGFGDAFSSTGFAPAFQTNGQVQTGIWVGGYGSLDVEADIADVYLGIESRAATVAEARQAAADAMQRVIDAVKAQGVDDEDIVTTSFSIYPEQTWVEVTDELGRHGEPRIIGYIVSNQVKITVRDIGDPLTNVLDQAVAEGGDLVRVNSVSFGLSNPEEHASQIRQLAAADARAKAELYAAAMEVELGQLIYLAETGASTPVVKDFAAAERAMAGADAGFAPTPIQPGDVTLSASIQAAFAIVQ